MANIAISALRDSKEQTGIGHHISHLVRALQEIDTENNYTLYICQDVYDKYEIPEGVANFKKVKINFNASNSLWKMLWTLFYLPIRLRKDKIDLIHFPAFTFFLFMGKPIVLTLHDIAEFRMSTNRYSLPRVIFRKTAHPIVVKIADQILAVSEYTKSEIIRYLKVQSDKMGVTYNGVGRMFRVLNKSESEKYVRDRYSIKKPFLLYVSRLQHPSKNHVKLIQAFKQLKEEQGIEHQLVFIGPRTPSDREIFAAIHDLHLEDEVIYTGYVPDGDLPQFYNAADLFVCPSLFEGFGMPIIEAMACGTPVAASNLSSLPEVVGNAGLLFDPCNVEEMKRQIHKGLTDAGERKALIGKGLARAREFSWTTTAQKTLAVYRDLL